MLNQIMIISLFIFHRDIRYEDNTALLRAMKESDKVIPIFIFTPEQIDQAKNEYFSHAAVQFMCESLKELPHLHIFYGKHKDVLQSIFKHIPFSRVYQNEDYSVYARKRDNDIHDWCNDHNVQFIMEEDYGLFPLTEGLVDDERPYTILAQFYKKYLNQLHVRVVNKSRISPKKMVIQKLHGEIDRSELQRFYIENPNIAQHGGRKNGLRILSAISTFKEYKNTRDFPSLDDGTTKASAHLKFGTISIREFYWACVKAFDTKDHSLIRELIFRDFYLKIYALRPELQRGTAFLHRLDKHIPWSYDKELLRAWKYGMTGFPLVDAGMRQLMLTNWCHNRVRMLVASVATKYFLLDWRVCAKYFYTQLVDADTFSNTAGWGWASSTGVDATLYFRAPFNPFLQSKKFDKDTSYIKKYVPELANVSPSDIHKWWDPKVRSKYNDINYPAPIVSYKEASAHALKIFKAAALDHT